jgi:iron complex outermembrane receptor protein
VSNLIGFNASYNNNKITKLTLAQDSTYLGSPYGDIGGAVGNKIQMNTVDYPAFSFFVFEQVYDENGHPIEGIYIDRNGDGESTEADKYHYKKPAPDIFMGINSTLTYKDISLSFAGRINLGNYVYNNIESQYADYSGMYNSVGYLGNRYRTIYDTEFEGPQYWSDYFVQNASFFRMDHITLNYTLNNVINDKSDVKIYGSVQNAFVITKYRGLDPERDNGIDNSVYPRPRTFTLGVKVDF